MKYFLDKNYAVADHTIVNYSGNNTLLKVPDKIDNIHIYSIGKGALSELYKLQYVKLPSKLKSIGDGAFTANSQMVRVEIPGTLQNIGTNVFYRCSRLSEIKIYDYPVDEKEYHELKNNSILSADDIYVARKVPEIRIIKDIIKSCNITREACNIPDYINRLFYTNEWSGENEDQLRNRNVNNICFIGQDSTPITETQGVMECIQYPRENLSTIKSDEVNDIYLKRNKTRSYFKTAVFTFDDKETKDIIGKKSISITIKIGYFFFQSVCRLIYNEKQYYVYQKYYLSPDNEQEYVRKDVAIYTDKGLVTDEKEAQKVYAKYKFVCIL